MVENEPFLYYGNEEPIQIDFIKNIILVDTKPTDFIFFIEFVYLDELAEVWAFTDTNERQLAFEYVELSIARYAVINKIQAKMN